MKRAAFLCIATATLLLLGLPSTPLQADTQINAKSTSPSFVAPGTAVGVPGPGVANGGGGGGGGGTDEGDADGLSGLKGRPPLAGSANRDVNTNSIFLELWWKFMILWAR
jgi:hypothetical protein